MGFVIEIDDHSDEVLAALENAINRGLKAAGMAAEGYAKGLCPRDTGNLQDHIKSEVEGHDLYIGVTTMNPPYGIYVEFGTGIYSTVGGRQTPWVYKDKAGEWHLTHGMRAQPFIKPAAADHANEYMQILKNSLENA